MNFHFIFSTRMQIITQESAVGNIVIEPEVRLANEQQNWFDSDVGPKSSAENSNLLCFLTAHFLACIIN